MADKGRGDGKKPNSGAASLGRRASLAAKSAVTEFQHKKAIWTSNQTKIDTLTDYEREIVVQLTKSSENTALNVMDRSYFGLVVKKVGKLGLFVALVTGDSIAEEAGIEFGDEIISIDGQGPADMGTKEAGKAISHPQSVRLVIHKPRTISLTRRSTSDPWGFAITHGTTLATIKPGSPAQVAKLPPGHSILSINGMCTIGMPDDDICQLLATSGQSLELKLRRVEVYKELLSCLGLRINSKRSKFESIFPPSTLRQKAYAVPQIQTHTEEGGPSGHDTDGVKDAGNKLGVMVISDKLVPSPQVSRARGQRP